jgi:murein DD-endopeptidase
MAFHGDRSKNENWYGYGAEVLAVADAVVSDVQDDIPENVPLQPERPVKINRDSSGGNYVTLDLGNGRFVFFAHLQPHRIRVKPGERVRRGQVLGYLGNAGNSTNPHLHFHVSDGRKIFEGEGLPFVFDAFNFLGDADLGRAIEPSLGVVTWKPQPGVTGEKRRYEIPLDRAVIEFR